MEVTVLAIKNRLGQWMAERGWTQEHTADVSGVHVTTVRRLQNQFAKRVDLDTMGALCRAFGKDVGEFWYEDGQ